LRLGPGLAPRPPPPPPRPLTPRPAEAEAPLPPGAYTRSLLSSTKVVLVTPPGVVVSNRLGETHALNVSNKMCSRCAEKWTRVSPCLPPVPRPAAAPLPPPRPPPRPPSVAPPAPRSPRGPLVVAPAPRPPPRPPPRPALQQGHCEQALEPWSERSLPSG
jgi:hypothetical protein